MQQKSHSLLISRTVLLLSTCWGYVVSRWLCYGGWEFTVNSCYQKTSAAIQLTLEDSPSVCVDVHTQPRVFLPLRWMWIGWMVQRLWIGASLVLAGRQKTKFYCLYHQTRLNGRYSQSADTTSSMPSHTIVVFYHTLDCTCVVKKTRNGSGLKMSYFI